MKCLALLAVMVIAFVPLVLGQSVGIGTASPHASAQLDVAATDKGMLLPRVSLSNVFQAAPLTSPATGILVWNTNDAITNGQGVGFYFWNGSRWQKLTNNSEGWSITGNIVDTAIHFVGTTSNNGLMFRVGNQKAGGIFPFGGNTFLGAKAGRFLKLDLDAFTGENNTFIGSEAGESQLTGVGNTFLGSRAGLQSKGGHGNTFLGYQAGAGNPGGDNNTSVGIGAGGSTTGSRNVSIGSGAGGTLQNGYENVMIGYEVGTFLFDDANAPAYGNVWIGSNAATGNFGLSPKRQSFNNVIIGDSAAHKVNGAIANVFVGKRSGMNSLNGRFNVFVGDSTGINNSSGNNNTFIGSKAKGNVANLTNATAIGSNALAGASNTLVLGSINGLNGATVDTRVGIGTTTPLFKLHLQSNDGGDGTVSGGILIENASTSAGEPGISFSNAGTEGTGSKRWTIGLNQGRNLGFNYGTLFSSVNIHATLDSTGKLGLGTITPAFRLHVSGNVQGGGAEDGILIENRNTTGVGKAVLGFRNAGTGGTGNSYWFTGLNAGRNLSFAYGDNFVNSNVHMVLDSLGRLGIGTTAPNRKLVVEDGSSSGITPSSSSSVVFDKGGAPNYVSIHGSAGQEVGILFGVAGAPVQNATGGILYNSVSVPNGFNFRTNGNVARMAITSDGRVGIGTLTPGYQLELSQNSAAKPTSSSWTVASDVRLKKDIRKFEDGLDVLNKIDPIWFTYTGEWGLPQETGVGTTAQAMQQIVPYMVKTVGIANGSEMLGVDYGPLQFILVNAVKQQQLLIKEQRDEINDLKKRLEALEKRN